MTLATALLCGSAQAEERKADQPLEFVECLVERKSDSGAKSPDYQKQFMLNLPDTGLGKDYEKVLHFSSRAVVIDISFNAQGTFKVRIEESGLILQNTVKIDLKNVRKTGRFVVQVEKANLKYSIECKK